MEKVPGRKKRAVFSFLDENRSFLLGIILILSAYIKFIYVFHDTAYENYLVSDMGAYWDAAVHSYYRGDFDPDQWSIWPPFGHMVLAWIFKILYLFGLYPHKLEIVLSINIFLSTLTVWFVYRIALHLFPSGAFALLTATIYAFFFPLIYFNAFILSENPSLFVYLLAVVMLLDYKPGGFLHLFVTGIVLAFAIAIRPGFGVAGLPFFLYILLRDGFSKRSLLGALIFSSGYFLFLLLVVANNNAISAGKLKGLSANGGLNYYFTACHKHTVRSVSDEGTYVITAAATDAWPELGSVTFHVPFYRQEVFYDKAAECLREKPFTFAERFRKFRLLYFDAFFPIMFDAKFAREGIPLFSKIALGMTAILLFLPFLFYDRRASRSTLLLLIGLALSQLIVLYFFNIEQRYLYGFFFVIALLSLLIPFVLVQNFKRFGWVLLLYALVLGGGAYRYHRTHRITQFPIHMTLQQNEEVIDTLHQPRKPIKTESRIINTIHFKTKYQLTHADLGAWDYRENFFADFNTTMHLNRDLNITFLLVSDDGYALKLDGKPILSDPENHTISVDQITRPLTRGDHALHLAYFQEDEITVLRLYYEVNGERFFVGEESRDVNFSLPEKRSANKNVKQKKKKK